MCFSLSSILPDLLSLSLSFSLSLSHTHTYTLLQAQSKSASSPPPPPSSSSGGSRQENLQDLIVLGLDYGASDEDLKNYFKKYGEVTHAEVHAHDIVYIACEPGFHTGGGKGGHPPLPRDEAIIYIYM